MQPTPVTTTNTTRAELAALALRAGRTPFYVYDTAVVDRQLAAVRAVLPPTVQLHYALKANPLPALVAHLAAHVDGFDIASGGELAVVLATLAAGARAAVPRFGVGFDVGFAGPGKSLADLAAGVAAGVLFQCESVRELQAIAAAGTAAGRRPRVALRINPALELRGVGQRMGGGAKPFGIDAETAPEVLRLLATLPVEFVGLHFYAGSQMLQASTVVAMLEQCYACALVLAAQAPAPVRVLNLGGGFGVPYFAGETALELAPIAAALERLVVRAATDLPGATLVLELGRYLVAEAGRYVMRVVDRKRSRGQVFLIGDGGMHHHLAASGNLGQVLRRNFPVTLVPAAPTPPVGASLLATPPTPPPVGASLLAIPPTPPPVGASLLAIPPTPPPVGASLLAIPPTPPPVGASLLAILPTEIVTICGPLCTPLDVLAESVLLPVAQEGDFIVVGMSGAYGATASPRGFLSHPGPVELLTP